MFGKRIMIEWIKFMEAKDKKQIVKSRKRDGTPSKKRKSKITLWWEKNPNGIFEIADRKAVLK